MWLETAKREKLRTILRGWIRTGQKGTAGIPFKEFESTIAKVRHAFTCIPMGASLLSPCNRILKVKPAYVYLNRNKRILTAIEGCRTLVLLWLTMEEVCGPLKEKRLTLFNDNSPTIWWATKLASKRSMVAEHLIQVLALRAKQNKACPFTPMHVAGKRMAIADIPLRSFGSNPVWHYHSDNELLTLFNSTFPLPSQQSWTVFHLDCKTAMRVISALRMKPFVLDNWRRLPSPG